ncbi:hypothetical protein A4A49_61746, partial [Nicotiana attenuata]
ELILSVEMGALQGCVRGGFTCLSRLFRGATQLYFLGIVSALCFWLIFGASLGLFAADFCWVLGGERS